MPSEESDVQHVIDACGGAALQYRTFGSAAARLPKRVSAVDPQQVGHDPMPSGLREDRYLADPQRLESGPDKVATVVSLADVFEFLSND